jgi:gliding motility-associated-like protein
VFGATFTYYTTLTGNTTTVPGALQYNPNVPILNLYVTQTLNGCESDRATYNIASYPKPAPPVVASPLNLCQFAVVGPLTAGGQNINWYENANGGVPLLSAPVPQTNIGTPSAGNPERDSFFATQTVNGCESDRAFLQVIINYQPNATFIPSKRFVCVDDTISFVYYGNADVNASYTWSVPRPAGREVSGQGTQGPFVARFDSVGVYDINLIVSANGCTSTPVYQRIEVRDRPETRINAKRQVCIDEVVEISLDSMSEGISNYNFTFDDGRVEYATYDAGPFGVSWSTPGQKQIIVNSTSRLCGSRTQAEIINVRPAPGAAIQDKPTGTICAADSVRLQAVDLGPGYQYVWTPSNIFQDRANRGTTVFTTPFYRQGKYYAMLTVTDSVGCEGQDSVEINTLPCCDVYFPNAFAPGSQNEKNNRFGMISQGVPTRFTLRVMNRWGRVMYETSDARQGWDGRYEGELQPTGTYFYYAKYRCASGEEAEQRGDITLIR